MAIFVGARIRTVTIERDWDDGPDALVPESGPIAFETDHRIIGLDLGAGATPQRSLID